MPDQSSNTQTIIEVSKYLGGFMTGAFLVWLREWFQHRKAYFTKRIWGQSLAFSHQSNDWGNIQVLYDNAPSKNLHLVSAEIINTSNKDFEDLIFEFSVPEGCTIYRHQGALHYEGVIKILQLEEDFDEMFEDVRNQNQIALQNNEMLSNALREEIAHVIRYRKFDIPVLKGKTKATFDFLVEDHVNNQPVLTISILEPNIRLVTAQDENKRKIVQRKWLEIGGLIIFGLAAIPIYKYSTSILMAVILMIANLFFCSIIALGAHNIYYWIKKPS